ncbi:MAG: hypothetical protein LBR84_03520, partial [Tannerella sp.]|nr:hypothetical protein [Tannerella sp.]
IPQITTYGNNGFDDSFHLKVKYRLGNITAEKCIYYHNPIAYNSNNNYQCVFEMGKQYNMRLDFTQTAIQFSVTVQDWPVAIETN